MFKNFAICDKVQSYDKDGYYIMEMCGFISEIFDNGHAIIKSFSGFYQSLIGIRENRIAEVEKV